MTEDFAARLAQVQARYLERLAVQRDELLSAPPPERLLVLVHNLAGSGGTYGFHDISEYALALESALQSGEPAAALTGQLLTAIDKALS